MQDVKPTICCQSSICEVQGGILSAPLRGILIDARDDGYLTSEASCQLPIRTMTNVVGCDGNDGNMQIFHAASNPDVVTGLCAQDRWIYDM